MLDVFMARLVWCGYTPQRAFDICNAYLARYDAEGLDKHIDDLEMDIYVD